jgi:rod shape determining protein RodA
VLVYLALVVFGWMSIYAATFDELHRSAFDMTQNHGKQMVWFGLSLVLIIGILLIDQQFFETFSYVIYGFAILLLVSVLIFGSEIKGAQSWFVLGPVSFQPSELAKYGTALALAKFLSNSSNKLDSNKTLLYAFGIILTPVLFIMLQPDVGSTLVFAALVIVLYRQGLSGWLFILAFAAILIFVVALFMKRISIPLWGDEVLHGSHILISSMILLSGTFMYLLRKVKGSFMVIGAVTLLSLGYYFSVDYVFDNLLKPHHQNRISELLGIVSDPLGAGYNVHQSKIAIGSGGFSGKGFLQGTQTKFHFVPEQSTDFIFCTVGEEWGFLGSFVLVSLFVVLIGRIIWMADKQRSMFTKIYGYCVASILFLHFTINIAMTIGLAPVIGIPLPFFSYGGSSLWSFTVLLFTYIKLDSERKYVLR